MASSPVNPESSDASTASAPNITAYDRLRSIYRHHGPYVSVYLDTAGSLFDDWNDLKPGLVEHGAGDHAIEAIEARLGLPRPEDTAGHCIIAASDGTTIVDHAAEPPHYNFGVVDTLPYAAPLLEWDQRRLPHLVVTIDGEGADVTTFDADHHAETRTYTNGISGLIEAIVDQTRSIRARLIVVAGEPQYRQPLVEGVVTHVPVTCRVVGEEPAPAADLADTVVRLVSDTIARTTVEHLRDYRFLRTHEAAADGVDATVKALIDGSAELVLIHDDPGDQRRLWVGTAPGELSFDLVDGYIQARLNDAIIRSAVLQDIEIYIIPSTGVTGPEEDTGALTG